MARGRITVCNSEGREATIVGEIEAVEKESFYIDSDDETNNHLDNLNEIEEQEDLHRQLEVNDSGSNQPTSSFIEQNTKGARDLLQPSMNTENNETVEEKKVTESSNQELNRMQSSQEQTESDRKDHQRLKLNMDTSTLKSVTQESIEIDETLGDDIKKMATVDAQDDETS